MKNSTSVPQRNNKTKRIQKYKKIFFKAVLTQTGVYKQKGCDGK